MAKIDIKSMIIPTELENTDPNQREGNKSFQTKDLIFLDSYYEVKGVSEGYRISYPTDYAVMNNARMSRQGEGFKNRKSCWTWLRSAQSSQCVRSIDIEGSFDSAIVYEAGCGLSPALHLDISSVISAQKTNSNFFKISNVKVGNALTYHTIEFGEYPKTYVGDKKNEELEKLYSSFTRLKKTGRTYTGGVDAYQNPTSNPEFEYEGKKYVRVLTKKYDDDSEYSDGTMAPEDGTYMWACVEPIVWKIRNWEELPKEINPNGNGKAKFIDVRTEDAIISGIPFYPDCYYVNCSMWQNSFIRAYLNGYNLEEQLNKGNGHKHFKVSQNFDFTKSNFLSEAFNGEYIKTLIKNEQEQIKLPEQANIYNLDYSILTNDQMLAMYVEANTSVFLHGPSGVGKSGRVKQLDPTATRITLRPQMNPEEIDGTLNRETGEYIPPLWWTQLKAKCEQEPNRKHILFIDELTNVKPTVQSLVYSIVLDRAGKDGLWPLPENAVVVAAGNESQNNLAAYPLTNALFRRFSHIYYEVKMEDWFNWASGITEIPKLEHKPQETKNQERIHPLILTFVMSRKDVLNQELDEENPQIVTDPRKWEIASRVLYATKNPYSLKPAIGEELTEDFVNFTKNLQITVQDVISGNYNKQQLQRMDTSEKYVNTIGLKIVSEEHVGKIRQFIQENFGDEYLTMFDVSWIGNNQERAMIIAELMQQEDVISEEQGNEM